MELPDRSISADPLHDGRGAPRDASQAARESARVYAAPRLAVFGNVERLTMKVGSKGKRDGTGTRRTGF